MIKKNPLPSPELLGEMFCYDAEMGILTWRRDKGRAKKGNKVGNLNASGHLATRLNGVSYLVHRIIWKLVTGQEPIDEIDHIDCNGSNNSWTNLRECTRPQNMANARAPCTNTSGVKCVNFKKDIGKWHAKIRSNNKENHIGYFDSLEEAAAAVSGARAKLHGEFARAV